MKKYFIVFNPATFDFMNFEEKACASTLDLLTYLSGRDASALNAANYLEYLRFDPQKIKMGMVELFGLENGAATYVGNQIARLEPDANVVHVDEHRLSLPAIIAQRRARPAAIFMTSITANFPTAAATALALNYARIPVVLGGIHVSTALDDVQTYIRDACPHPELILEVRGPGDSQVIGEILRDLDQETPRRVYQGYKSIEDGVWRTPPNVQPLPPMYVNAETHVPWFGRFLRRKVQVTPMAPFWGCPYSCSFCSISTLPAEQRRFTLRSAEDFLAEVAQFQEAHTDVAYPIALFSTDNLLLGGKVLDDILDGIAERKLRIPFMAQISIDVASNERLLARLRRAGALLFEIGFESLDLRNLKFINKNAVHDVLKSGLSVAEYYSRQIRKIQEHGIAIQGSFMFGLPFDRFDSLTSNTGVEVANFCIENRISLMAGCFSATPGAKMFQDSLDAGAWLYGRPGTMDYLRSLCLADHGEMNIRPGEGVFESPLVVAAMALEALRAVRTRSAWRNALYLAQKSFAAPTARGKASRKARMEDAALSFATHLITANLYGAHGEALAASRNGFRGGLERLYTAEKNLEIKELLESYVAQNGDGGAPRACVSFCPAPRSA